MLQHLKVLVLILSFSLLNGKVYSSNHFSDTIDVIHYDIHLDVVHLSNKQIGGNTHIKFVSKLQNLSQIKLDLLNLNIDSVVQNATHLNFQYNDTLLEISLLSAMNVGDTTEVEVYYHGQPTVESYGWGGFHIANDSSLAYNLGVAFFDNPHNYGRVWFPCLDEFTDRASFDFHIRVDSNKIAVCSGELISEIWNVDGTHTYHWQLLQTVPSYLVGVAVSNYHEINDTILAPSGQIPANYYVRPQQINQALISLEHVPDMLISFENRFGPYRWPRVGYVSTAKGAMEHACNIAIPHGNFNGNHNSDWLFAHELSHHWFGDLVTCSSPEDMWLNEGWAVFCEEIFTEDYYGKQAARDYARANAEQVLQFAHTASGDGSYQSVYGIPHELTYGTTVYDKGGMMAHSLRAYLGDSIFFDVMKKYLDHFAFNHASSTQLRDFISDSSGIDMTDWFQAWIFEPGFLHFSIDSFRILSNSGSNHLVRVYTRQKLKGRSVYANSNRVEVRFMSNKWKMFDAQIEFDAPYDSVDVSVPFKPDFILVDPDEKTSDATTDCLKVLDTLGLIDFPNTKCALDVKSLNDSVLVQVEHSWVAPDPMKTNYPGFHLNDNRYWKIDGTFSPGTDIQAKFYYSRSAYLDASFITNANDSLVMYYRPNKMVDWGPVPFFKLGNDYVGNMYVDHIQRGEYVLAKWESTYLPVAESDHESEFKVYPNPTKHFVRIEYPTNQISKIEFYHINGQLIDSLAVVTGTNKLKWRPKQKLSGTVIIKGISARKGTIYSRKVVFQ